MATNNGSSGDDIICGTSGADNLNGGAGSDTLDGGAGSDRLNGGSGNDTLIYNLTDNLSGSNDVYTGGSGIDTILMQLSLAQWSDPLVRAQLQAYLEHLATVKMNVQCEVSNGSASDFVFRFDNGTTLTVQMMEKLVIAVPNASGQYVPIDYLQSLITGSAAGSVTEAGGVANNTAGTPTATGDLHADDLNGVDDAFQAVGPGAVTTYGTYSVAANGVWTYTLDNNNATVQGLHGGELLFDSFTVLSADGTAQVVKVTITGTNDVATVSSETKAVTEGNTAAALNTSGQLTITDPDAGEAHVVAQSNVSGTYGSFTIDADGAWSYTGNGAHDELTAGQVVQDQFTVYSQDGTASGTVKVTITGTNDAPIDVTLTITSDPSGSNVPQNTQFGQFSVPTGADPDGGGAYIYTLLSLTETNLTTGATITDTSADMSVSATGGLSTGNGGSALETGRIYEMDVQVSQSGAIYHEFFSVITGTNQDDSIPSTTVAVGDDVIYGLQDNDIILAGSGNDTLFGQNGNDKLVGGAGADRLTGGSGRDTFVFLDDDLPGVDTITDFNTAAVGAPGSDGDVLDISDVLVGSPTLNSSNIGDYLSVSVVGGNSTISIDRDGAGSTFGFQDLALLTGVTGLNLSTLLTNGNIDWTP